MTNGGLDDGSSNCTNLAEIDVVLVTAFRCHLCDHARSLLDELGARYPLAIREVDLESDEGRDIVNRLRVPFPPILLLNGTYFGHGRLSRAKLVKTLGEVAGLEGVVMAQFGRRRTAD